MKVVYGARNQVPGSDGSGTLPKPPFPTPRTAAAAAPPPSRQQQHVGQLGAEDIRRLRAIGGATDANYVNQQMNGANSAFPNMSAISPNMR